MTDLTDYARLVARDHGLATVSTLRADQTIQALVVNTVVLDCHRGHQVASLCRSHHRGPHPSRPTAAPIWLFLAPGVGHGQGTAELIGPDDPAEGFAADAIRLPLRSVFVAAGGTHDDWASYDRVMAEERRAAVLVSPVRLYG